MVGFPELSQLLMLLAFSHPEFANPPKISNTALLNWF